MAVEKVGGLFYEVTYDTSKMIEGQRAAERSVDALGTKLTAVSSATKIHAAGLAVSGTAAREAARATDSLAVANTKAADATEQHTSSSRRLFSALRGNKLAIADVIASLGTGQGLGQALLTAKGAFTALAGAAAAAVGAVLIGFVQGRKEAEEFNRSVTLTGNVSGTTADKLGAMAERLDSLSGITRGQAAEALNLFAEAGVRGGDGLAKFAEAAIRLEQAGGPAVAATVKAFDALAADPVAASLKLNESVNFLTVDLYKQIKALEDQGKKTEAARVAQTAYADALLERTPKITEKLGSLQRAWRSVTTAAREGWDALLNIGREDTPEERLQAMRDRLAKLQRDEASGGTRTIGGRETGAGRAARQQEIAQLLQQVRAYDQASQFAQQAADADADRVAKVRAAAEADKKADAERRSTRGPRKDRFDDTKYLLDLQEQSADAMRKVSLIEQEALSRNDKLLRDGEITFAVHEKAKTLIEQAAIEERRKLWLQAAEERRALIQKQGEDEAKDRKRAGEFAAGIVAEGNPEEQTRQRYVSRAETLAAMRAAELLTEQQYAAAVVANAEQMQEQLDAIAQQRVDTERATQMAVLSMTSGAAGQMLDLLQRTGKERTALGKALFLTQKAIAVAEIIMNTEVAAAKAGAQLGIFGIPMAVAIRAAGYTSAGLVAGLAIGEVAGRQYGGPTSAGSLYRVNETGRPEMFTAANGAQYMLPTKSGNVTPAGAVGGGVALQVQVINNHPTAQVTTNTDSSWRVAQIVIAELVDQVDNNSGSFYSALRRSTNVQGRLG